MFKTYLKSYWVEKFQALCLDSVSYKLELEKHYLWGLFKSTEITTIFVYCPLSKTTDKWDSLIASRKPLK